MIPRNPLNQPPTPPGETAPQGEPRPSPQEFDLLEALLSLDGLGRLPRTGWLQAGLESPESIAAHTTGVAFLALALAEREQPPLNPKHVVALALLHDAPEALLGDLPLSASRLLGANVKHQAERRAADQLLPALGQAALELFEEVHSRQTSCAKFVELCDKLHLGLQLVHHRRLGRRGLDEFERGLIALDCGPFNACRVFKRDLLRALKDANRSAGNSTL